MGKPPKRKHAARNNVKKARQKLAEGAIAQGLGGEDSNNDSAELPQSREPVSLLTIVSANTELEHTAPDSPLQGDYGVPGPSGHQSNENPNQTAPNTPSTHVHNAQSPVDEDVGSVGDHVSGDDVGLDNDVHTGEQHAEDTRGPLIEEDSGSEGSDYEIRVETHPISETEANQLVHAIEQAQAAVEASYQCNKEARRPVIDDLTKRRILLMTASLNLRCHLNCGMTTASLAAAAALGLGPWAARMARKWIRQFQATGTLPENLYGKWNSSIIEDEDFSQAIQEYLRSKGRYAQAHDVREFFQTEEARPFRYLLDAAPSIRTAQRWMEKMGFSWGKERRGQFVDGHERPDVVEYRMQTYIPAWMEAERRMRDWVDGKEIEPQLRPGERRVIWWFHDESTFYAHDRRLTRWTHRSETPTLSKKGEGASLMVADFVSAEYGWLRRHFLPGVHIENVPPDERDARVTWRAGNGRDGWFVTKPVCEQLARAIKIVKAQYPDEDHVFVYDNAPSHTKVPEDVPNVSRMTLGKSLKVKAVVIGPSGDKVKVNMAPARFADGTPQELYHPPDHPDPELRSHFKGLTVLLQERGVPGAERMKLLCPKTNELKGCTPGSTTCCARRAMASQPDFLELWRKSEVQRLAESSGCSLVYLPKYHCELNPIEQCWGYAKRVYRDFPMSSSESDLKKNALAALDAVPLESIRRFALRSRRFVHAYARGLTGAEAIWANKQYHSHRVVTESVMRLMDRPNDP